MSKRDSTKEMLESLNRLLLKHPDDLYMILTGFTNKSQTLKYQAPIYEFLGTYEKMSKRVEELKKREENKENFTNENDSAEEGEIRSEYFFFLYQSNIK